MGDGEHERKEEHADVFPAQEERGKKLSRERAACFAFFASTPISLYPLPQFPTSLPSVSLLSLPLAPSLRSLSQ